MRSLDIAKKASDYVDAIPAKQFKQIYSKILDLRKNHLPNDSKKLSGYKDLYRVSAGEYRIIYSFDDNVVYIHLVGKRNDGDIYKQLKNLEK